MLPGGAHGGTYRADARVPYYAYDYLLKNVSTTGYSSIQIDFWYKTPIAFGPNDHLRLWVYDGITWHELADYTNLSISNWTFVTHTIAVPTGVGQMQIRFDLDFASPGEISLDDVVISGIQAPPPLDPVIIIPGILGSWPKNGQMVIDPVLHTYDDLIDTLKANGYTEGTDLFTFPYEWRNSNVDSAVMLKNKIDAVKAICQCAKVDLVAHSMGGLVARQYIQSDQYQNDVDQLIFLGTPHLGAVDSYLSWEGGEVAPSRTAWIKKFLFTREAQKFGYPSLFAYIHDKIPSVQELLPMFDYLRDQNTGVLRTYPTNYPPNMFLENLNNNVSTLVNSGVRISNFFGNVGPSTTIKTLRVLLATELPLWQHGFPENFGNDQTDQGLGYGEGDRTVTISSSTFIQQDLKESNSEHSQLVGDLEGEVYKKLTGQDANTLVHTDRGINYSLLLIKILSPVDVQVIAPDGKRIGKDFVTNQEIDEIPNAFYSGFETDDEYVTILNPLEGDYQVLTHGTNEGGEYTIAAGLVTDQGLSDEDTQAYTLPGEEREVIVMVDNSLGTIDAEDTTSIAQGDFRAHILQMYNLGWIKKAMVRDQILKEADKIDKLLAKKSAVDQIKKNAQKKLVRLDKRLDKETKKLVDKLLADALKKGDITSNAYNLIQEDLNALTQ